MDWLLEKWGLTRRNVFKWLKPNHLGLGNWLRHGCEYCILATKGKSTIRVHNQIDYGIFSSYKLSSVKPSEMYDIAERCGDAPFGELFARRKRKGWAQWGNEIASDFVIPGFPVPLYSGAVTGDAELDCFGSSPDDHAWIEERRQMIKDRRERIKAEIEKNREV